MVTCKYYNRGGAPLTTHQWAQNDVWSKLLCAECGAGLSEEGVVQLAIDYQAELRELRAVHNAAKAFVESDTDAPERYDELVDAVETVEGKT